VPLYSGDFGKAFSKLLELSGVSCYEISKHADIDEAYLSKLRSGVKHNPSPEAIMRICLAIARCSKEGKKVDLYDFDTLFNAVGRSLFTGRKSSL